MSQKPLEELIRSNPQAADLLHNPAALRQLLASPETKKLMELLGRQGGAALQGAAQAAAAGNPDRLMGLVNQVMDSREGAQTVEALKKKTQR